MENASSKTLFLDGVPSIKEVYPYAPRKKYYLSTAIDTAPGVFHKNGSFCIPIHPYERKVFSLVSQIPVDYYTKSICIDETTGDIIEIPTGTASELEFILFVTNDNYFYSNYNEYVDVVKKHGKKCTGRLVEKTQILIPIGD